MSSIEFRNAYYIKLGKGGCWETDSLKHGRLRLGWRRQSIDDINAGRWELIEQQLRAESSSKLQVATNDLNRLRDIALSTPEDIWVTFHGAKLWWTRLAPPTMEEDDISKFRRTQGAWSDRSLLGQQLFLNEIPGKLSQLQGFRGTACRVRETGILKRILEGKPSRLTKQISERRRDLCESLQCAIQELHWKDYETLVDLVFRHAGWVRVSVLGQQAKGYDLELREPVTNDRYVVQVKSQAGRRDLEETILNFSPNDYRRVFFVVHSPSADLSSDTNIAAHVELIPPQRLAELALQAGLSRWLEMKVA